MASSPEPSPDPILRIHCIKVFVRDQERSLRFYLDQLGFRPTQNFTLTLPL